MLYQPTADWLGIEENSEATIPRQFFTFPFMECGKNFIYKNSNTDVIVATNYATPCLCAMIWGIVLA